MSLDLNQLTAPFAEEELRHFTGRGGKEMTYIEDETVMDRLDGAFGLGNWQVLTEPVPVYEGVVKVRLGIRTKDGWSWYEDYGYPNQAGGDVLKEAVSDGIRRCGRYLGIARDLYRKRTYEGGHRQAPTPIRQPVRSSTAMPEMPEFPDDFGEPVDTRPPLPGRPFQAIGAPQPNPLEGCPDHPGEVWRGVPGDLYHKMPNGEGYHRPEGQPQKARAK